MWLLVTEAFALSLIIFLIAVNQADKDGVFSIGQTLRIRVGPLKGYLCRVIAVRRSDVTVKLDSKQKVLTGLSNLIHYQYHYPFVTILIFFFFW